MNCSSLESFTFPPHSVNHIGKYVFYGCSSLKEITIPDTVVTMGNGIFGQCTSLEKVTLGENLRTINQSMFSGCVNLTHLVVNSKNLEAIDDTPLFPDSKLKSVTFGDKVSLVTPYLCKDQTELTEIVLPNTVGAIGKHAFEGCSSLTDITLPPGLTEIGSHAFAQCSSINSIVVPRFVNKIDEGAFLQCSSLQDLTFKGNVLKIVGKEAFKDCQMLNSAVLPYSVEQLGDQAFKGCSSLTSTTLPEYMYKNGLPHNCFSGCPLQEIYSYLQHLPNIPEGIPDTEYFDDSTFIEATLYVPKNLKETYSQAPMWCNFAKIEEMEWSDIDNVATDKPTPVQWQGVYTIDGRLLPISNASSLAPGLYIINGKKTLVR